MKSIRKLIPNKAINILKHFPLAVLANIVHGFPSRGMKFIGVTGTDGKTTTTNMIYQILKKSGFKTSMVSTINAEINGKKIDTGFHVTSPNPFLLQRLIGVSLKSGTEIFVLEVTSHGLDQFRTWGINFDVGVITNITHEHLDYHKTWINYFNSKSKLIKNSKTSVLNIDEDHFKKLADIAKNKVITFGQRNHADFNPQNCKCNLSIFGDYNVLNALASVAAVSVFGVAKQNALKILEEFNTLEGRMEYVENNLGINIFVDFAHTPNGLKSALTTLRKKTKARLISVFGCAGLRDEKKRSLMGEISANIADITIITAEDPRGEIQKINEQILIGVEKGGGILGKDVYVEIDRQKAISFAIKEIAKKGDTVGIFGKGHEKSINIDGINELPWSDFDVVRKVINEGKV